MTNEYDWDDTVAALPGILDDEVDGPTHAHLLVVRGNNVGETFRIVLPTMTIGRGAGADLRLNDENVSRFHCRLRQQGSEIVVEDLGSRNGTLCNGQLVRPGMPGLVEGDRLQIGTHTILRFTYVEVGTPAAVPEPADSVHDAVTGLYSRRYFMDRLEDVSAALRNKTPLALVLIHTDRFEEMAAEHSGVEAITIAIAGHLRKQVRQDDLIARLDGGDFALLSRWASPGDMFMLAERLRKSSKDLRLPGMDGGHVTLSLGVAAMTELRVESAHDLLVAAATALNRARSQGGDRVVHCTQDLLSEPKHRAKV